MIAMTMDTLAIWSSRKKKENQGILKALVLLSLLVEVDRWFSLKLRCRLSSSGTVITGSFNYPLMRI
ncbi:hypothetical protein MRX96_037573 [Rhipicephalus microplus]